MKRLSLGIQVILLLALVPQVVISQGIAAQGPGLQVGDKAQGFMNDRFRVGFEGKVTETWDSGFAIDVKGEPTPRRVEYADVESLQRSYRMGGRARESALKAGAVSGGLGFLLGYCVQIMSSSSECAENTNGGIAVGLVFGAAGALIGAGVGALLRHDSPFESVDLEDSRSGDLDRVSIEVLPHPDGRIGLGVTVGVGGGR
jgi:hypothetical protein